MASFKEHVYKSNIKPYTQQSLLKHNIIRQTEHDNKSKGKTGKFKINGTDFNWKYHYKFSSLAANLDEDGHLLSDLFRKQDAMLIFMRAIKYRMLIPITPLQFVQANYNPNINFIAKSHGGVRGKRSFTFYQTVESHSEHSNICFADRVSVMAGFAKIKDAQIPEALKGDILCTKMENDIKREKLCMLETAKYIDQCANTANFLYAQEFNIDFVDLDRNFHVNQSVYFRIIENCLFEYDQQFFEGKYFIFEILCNFKKELRLDLHENDRFKIGKGKAVIFANQSLEDDAKRIIGAVTQNNEMHAGFECILKQTSDIQQSRL